jgi:hypothetical protein
VPELLLESQAAHPRRLKLRLRRKVKRVPRAAHRPDVTVFD